MDEPLIKRMVDMGGACVRASEVVTVGPVSCEDGVFSFDITLRGLAADYTYGYRTEDIAEKARARLLEAVEYYGR